MEPPSHKWVAPGGRQAASEEERQPSPFPYRDDGSGRWTDFGRWEEGTRARESPYGNVLDFPEHERPFLGGSWG